jgi:membrane fusion protein, heavy metal efflux system
VLKEPFGPNLLGRPQLRRAHAAFMAILLVAFGIVAYLVDGHQAKKLAASEPELSSQARTPNRLYRPTDMQWASLTVETVSSQVFRSEHITEGKFAVDEDRSTLVFSPYSGRVIKILAKPGDSVAAGRPLFTVEATDMVQAQNDFIAAISSVNKARAALNLAQIVEGQNRKLFESKAGPLRDLQTAEAANQAAQNDQRTALVALEATRNRLRILGKTDDEIALFQDKGVISPETPIYAPIAGTVVSRKIGPGQYVNTGANSAGANETPFIIGDLSTVWLYAYVRETDAPKIRVGQPITFTVLAYPDQLFEAKVNYVASALDPNTRRLTVRATIENPQQLFKPEMFASVNIFTGEERNSAAIPRDALIYEGASVRVWVAREDRTIESRQVRLGLASGRMVQVLDGLQAGERVITKGSLFLDRAAAGS